MNAIRKKERKKERAFIISLILDIIIFLFIFNTHLMSSFYILQCIYMAAKPF